MPLQHINDRMLQADAAPREPGRHEELLGKLRAADPEPGDADHVHHRLPRRDRRASSRSWCEFVAEQQFERLGVFTYSFEPDTPAAKLPDHLPEEVKNERRDRLMAVQQEIAFEWNEAQIGRQLDVLIDRAVPDEKNAWIGRSLRRRAGRRRRGLRDRASNLRPGRSCPAKSWPRSEYDLVGVADRQAALSESGSATGQYRCRSPRKTQSPPSANGVFNVPNQLTIAAAGACRSCCFVLDRVRVVPDGAGGVRRSRPAPIGSTAFGPASTARSRSWAAFSIRSSTRSSSAARSSSWRRMPELAACVRLDGGGRRRPRAAGHGAAELPRRARGRLLGHMSGKLKMVLQCLAAAISLYRCRTARRRTRPMAGLAAADVSVWAAVAMTIYSGVGVRLRAIKLLRH